MPAEPCAIEWRQPVRTTRFSLIVTAQFSSLLLILTSPAVAANRYVANNGTDSGTCGATAASPCRSITQAIANASAGSQIIVGPGVYGDIDGDGVFTPDSGDETPSGQFMIEVSKKVTIVSRDGAASTVIRFSDAGGTLKFAIAIEADSVTLGKKNKGFTVLGNGTSTCTSAILAGNLSGGVSRTTIEGNITLNCNDGILDLVDTGATIEYNRAAGNAFGIVMAGGSGTMSNNAVSSNGTGIEATGGTYRVTKNAVAGSSDPSGSGMSLDAGDTVTKNSITGSGGAGIITTAAPAVLTANSIFGNGLAAGAAHNCGLNNTSGATITATGNYWGAATGPGADPADATCGDPVTATPAAPAEVKVLVTPIR